MVRGGLSDEEGAQRRRARAAAGIRHRRLVRTILLGTLALAAALYWLADSLGIEWAELRGYVLVSLLGVGVLVGAAALVASLFGLLRWLRRRSAP